MVIMGKQIGLSKLLFLILYYGLARWLPCTGRLFNLGGIFRRWCCQHIFKYCGENVNIERKAWFASGLDIVIGDNSGIGINAHIPNGTIIGKDVMMGPNCFILDVNHKYNDPSVPMIKQGMMEPKTTIIEDDVWIGRDVFMTPGRHISSHTVIAARCVLTKDFPEQSIIGGNPSRVIKSRLSNH